jgi:hypothetical protein
MARSRFFALAVVSLVLAAAFIRTGWSEGDKPGKLIPAALPATPVMPSPVGYPGTESPKADLTSKIYSLSDLGDDPNLGKWIAETIPKVIQPGTWTQDGTPEGKDKCVLAYYAPAKILVVYHTPAVQTKVQAFLANLKESLPQEKEKPTGKSRKAMGSEHSVVPSNYEELGPVKAVEPAKLSKSSYPVPSRAQQPKHLFHFIIRYEGEGIIDDNVAGLLKEIYGAKKSAKEDSETNAPRATNVP